MNANHQRFEAVEAVFGSIKDVKVGGLEGIMLRRFDGPARRFAQTRAVETVANQMPRFAIEALAFGGMLLLVQSSQHGECPPNGPAASTASSGSAAR